MNQRRIPSLLLYASMLASVFAAGESQATPTTAPVAPGSAGSAPMASAPPFAAAGTLRFAQISDSHLFDAGYKCSGLFVEREYEENLNAFRWAIDEVNRRWKSGDKIDFLVFTGDLGITNLAGGPSSHPAPDAGSACSSPGDSSSSYGPIPQRDFATAEAIVADILDCLPIDLPVYFIPGNNDLTDEDSATLTRYQQFVAGLRVLTHGRVTDLNERAIQAQGYTLVGLNSAGFKPQSYTDSHSGTIDEALIVARGKVANQSQSFYCDELKGGASGARADQKTQALSTYSALASGNGPYLVFTHEPDLQDPYLPRRQAAKAAGGSCEFRSTWLLTEDARKTWMANGLDSPKVVGIFAGHFHSDNLTVYGGPSTNSAVAAIYKQESGGKDPARPGGLAPIFVTPPLAVKLQWTNYPTGARGMMFISVTQGIVHAQIDPYWSVLASDCCADSRSRLGKFLQAWLKSDPHHSFLVALVFTIILVAIVLLLAGELSPRCIPTARGKVRILRWIANRLDCIRYTALKLMIDAETQTYSLSKTQFLLWTFATIYAYVYLFLAHTWVQGLPGLPDIADQFPWEISLSAGTAVASQISQRTIGTKGGGPLRPHLADLISAGGVIAPGRLQFFSWTVVAIAAYLSSVLASDPCTVHTLPSIPQNLLMVSGLSSLAYLSTRAVSTPGPVISSVRVTLAEGGGGLAGVGGGPVVPAPGPAPLKPAAPLANSSGALTLLGSGFSKMAVVAMVIDEAGAGGAAMGGGAAPVAPTANARPVTTQLDMTKSEVQIQPPPYSIDPAFAVPGNPDYATQLAMTVSGLDRTKAYRIRVTNPDGKFGEGEWQPQ